MIDNILIVDTETTGLSPHVGHLVIEIAAVLFNIQHRDILQCYTTLLPCDENPVQHINHISPELSKCFYSLALMDRIFIDMVATTQVIVAHNADFDRRFIETLSFGEAFKIKKWICTKNNFKWPCELKRYRLEDICNGMQVPYINAHRALNDCLLLAKCFQKVEDLQERFQHC